MASPFPGMDPYLEGSQWTSIHAELSVEIARQLSPRLGPGYVARTNERFVITMPESEEGVAISTAGIYPVAFVARATPTAPTSTRADSGTALAVAPPPIRVPTVMPEAVRHLTVEIRDVARRRLVTAIEVLSPTNKGPQGGEEYLFKRRRMLLSTAHLMEIDLLRLGERVPMQEPLPACPYFIFLSRAEKRPVTDVWPVQLSKRLPVVPVPLLPGDEDVPLDLQEALNSVYETFRYELTVDYLSPPEVKLSPEEASWTQTRIGAWRAGKSK